MEDWIAVQWRALLEFVMSIPERVYKTITARNEAKGSAIDLRGKEKEQRIQGYASHIADLYKKAREGGGGDVRLEIKAAHGECQAEIDEAHNRYRTTLRPHS